MSQDKYGRAMRFVTRAYNASKSAHRYGSDVDQIITRVSGHRQRVEKLSADAIEDGQREAALQAIDGQLLHLSNLERFLDDSVRAAFSLDAMEHGDKVGELGYEMDWDEAIAAIELEESESDIAPLMDREWGNMVAKRMLAEAALGVLDIHTADVWTAIYAFNQNRDQAETAIPYQEIWSD